MLCSLGKRRLAAGSALPNDDYVGMPHLICKPFGQSKYFAFPGSAG